MFFPRISIRMFDIVATDEDDNGYRMAYNGLRQLLFLSDWRIREDTLLRTCNCAKSAL